MKTSTAIIKKRNNRTKKQRPKQKRPTWLLWVIFTITMAGTFHEYVIEKKDGTYELSPER
ncbi:MAG: hypothetical protein AAF849_14655 [Bacteroidota bacterium]